MITPQACMPVFLNDPSINLACLITSPSSPSSSNLLISSSAFLSWSAFNFSFTSSFDQPNNLFNLTSGTNLANRSVSGRGKSSTLPVSLMEDLAAMVP